MYLSEAESQEYGFPTEEFKNDEDGYDKFMDTVEARG